MLLYTHLKLYFVLCKTIKNQQGNELIFAIYSKSVLIVSLIIGELNYFSFLLISNREATGVRTDL